jgi:type III pantothenate kinase
MDLVIDLGNTNKKLALFKNGKLFRLRQYPFFNLEIVRDFVDHNPRIDRCILASVVAYPQSVRNFLEHRFSFLEFTELTPIPILNRYRSKTTLGKDRLAAAVAAAGLFPGKEVLVINMGTCITYDFVNATGEYLGGAISPGIQMCLEALHTFTGKLPLVRLRKNETLIGNTTERSMLSGVLNGAIAEIEGITGRYREQFPELVTILSGGDAKYFDKQLKISIFALPNIVIHGLYQILDFNVIKAK